ncbi:hypothetical protein [Thermonema rossianum]|uniref:hypothetical protein n=1 Tax=Thermonema rossianum TaxID=55505 RepID=UPI0005716CB9|nr:hypothetical protein [Thermonema rossianum]
MKELKKKEALLNLEPLKIEEEIIYGGFSDVLEGHFAYESEGTNNRIACEITVNTGCNQCTNSCSPKKVN